MADKKNPRKVKWLVLCQQPWRSLRKCQSQASWLLMNGTFTNLASDGLWESKYDAGKDVSHEKAGGLQGTSTSHFGAGNFSSPKKDIRYIQICELPTSATWAAKRAVKSKSGAFRFTFLQSPSSTCWLLSREKMGSLASELQLFYWIYSPTSNSPFWTALPHTGKQVRGVGVVILGSLGECDLTTGFPQLDGRGVVKGWDCLQNNAFWFCFCFYKTDKNFSSAQREKMHPVPPNKYCYTAFSWSLFVHLQLFLVSQHNPAYQFASPYVHVKSLNRFRELDDRLKSRKDLLLQGVIFKCPWLSETKTRLVCHWDSTKYQRSK